MFQRNIIKSLCLLQRLLVLQKNLIFLLIIINPVIETSCFTKNSNTVSVPVTETSCFTKNLIFLLLIIIKPVIETSCFTKKSNTVSVPVTETSCFTKKSIFFLILLLLLLDQILSEHLLQF